MALAQELEQQQGALDQSRAGEMAAISQIEGQEAQVAAEKQKATAAPLQAATAAAADLSKTADQPLPPSEAASIGYTPHKADAKQIEGLSWALLGMALIGGAASKGNWLGVSSSLNGAMRGFIQGDQLKAQKEWEDFQTKFETAERHDKQALERMKTVRDNKNLSLNAKMQQYQLIAAQYDMQDAKLAAQLKSHDAVLKSIDSRENSITQARSRLEAVQERMEMQKLSMGLTGAGGGMSPKAMEWIEEYLRLGGTMQQLGVTSRYAANRVMPLINDMAEKNVDPADIISGKVDLSAVTAAARQTATRQAGMERLTTSVQSMEKKILTLAQKVVPSGMPAANAKINWLNQQFGSEDLAKFRAEVTAVSRQYMEAVTMPASNAQLHAGTSEMADRILNSDMTIGQLRGAFEGINEDIASGREGLGQVWDSLHAAIRKNGMQLKVGGSQDRPKRIKVDENGVPIGN